MILFCSNKQQPDEKSVWKGEIDEDRASNMASYTINQSDHGNNDGLVVVDDRKKGGFDVLGCTIDNNDRSFSTCTDCNTPYVAVKKQQQSFHSKQTTFQSVSENNIKTCKKTVISIKKRTLPQQKNPSKQLVVRHQRQRFVPKGGLPGTMTISKSRSVNANQDSLQYDTSKDKKILMTENFEHLEDESTSNARSDEFDDPILMEALLKPENQLLSCDTYMLLRTLQNGQTNQYCIEIPFRHHHETTIRGVLECTLREQLYNKSNINDSFITKELNYLINKNVVRTLSLSKTNDNLNVIVLTDDYVNAVRDAVISGGVISVTSAPVTDTIKYSDGQKMLQQQQQDSLLENEVLHWFVNDLLGQYTRRRITQQELHASWLNRQHQPSNDSGSSGTITFDSVLKLLLQQWNVIMNASVEHNTYQLWLPSFGMVIKAWDKARTKLLTELKRSYSKNKNHRCHELSHMSLQNVLQYNNPIPLPVLLTALASEGTCKCVMRPSGLFIQLCSKLNVNE